MRLCILEIYAILSLAAYLSVAMHIEPIRRNAASPTENGPPASTATISNQAQGSSNAISDPFSPSPAKRTNSCGGSYYCTHYTWFSGGVERHDCIDAYERFNDIAVYARYASFVYGHCAAIFDCQWAQDFHGQRLKWEFFRIWDDQHCTRCGIRYFVSKISQHFRF